MRISELAPTLTAVSKRSFDQGNANTFSAIDKIFPPNGQIRYLLDRGQAFGLYSKSVNVTSDLLLTKVTKVENAERCFGSRQYYLAEITIDMPKDAKVMGDISPTLWVYKDVHSLLYTIVTEPRADGTIDNQTLTEQDVALKMMDWSMAFATDNPLKQMPYLNMVSLTEPLPGETWWTVRIMADKISSYWRKTFE